MNTEKILEKEEGRDFVILREEIEKSLDNFPHEFYPKQITFSRFQEEFVKLLLN